MAWIESHQELARHPKTRRAARVLGIGIPQMIGHLHLLWWWSLDFADEGDLSAFDAVDIADGALWEGEPQPFVDALAAVGFLDADPADGLHLHDWAEYAGRLVEQRKANADKQRAWRERHKAQPSRNGDIPPADPDPPSGDMSHNGNVTVTSSVRNGATVHNTTQHNTTEPNPLESTVPLHPAPAADAAVVRVDNFTPFFDTFWQAYPARDGKKRDKIKTRDMLSRWPVRDWDDLLLAVTHYSASSEARRGFARDPCRFLAKEFWRDWLTPDSPTKEAAHDEHHPATRAERTESAWAAHIRPASDSADGDPGGRRRAASGPALPRRPLALPARVG